RARSDTAITNRRGPARDPCVQLPRRTRPGAERLLLEAVADSRQGCRAGGIPLSRLAPLVGIVAHAERDSCLRATAARWMVEREDGETLRAFGRLTSGDMGRQFGRRRKEDSY